MREAETVVRMHAYALIPLATLIAIGVLVSAVAAREHEGQSDRLVRSILLGTCVWSLCQLLWNTTLDAGLAALYMRGSLLGSLVIPPALFHLLVNAIGERPKGFRRLLPVAYLAALGCGLATVATDWVVAGAERTSWGWAMLAGPALPAVFAVTGSGPLAAGVYWILRRRAAPLWRVAVVELAGLICVAVILLTDVLLPLLEIPFPRLGSASFVAWVGVTWWSIYRHREPRLAPQKFAREILETLPDGVALVRPNGSIRATNERLGELAGRPAFALMGMPIAELLTGGKDAWSGPENESECELVNASGGRIPVSISRSALMDEEGCTIGHVLAVRDLREVVSLRGRLVASGRLAAIGQLAAGIAHEINNPLAYVRSNIGLLEQHWDDVGTALEKSPCGPLVETALEEGLELLAEASAGVDRVAAVVRDVGGFSRGGVAKTEAADVTELLDTAARVAAPQLEGARIERRYEDLPRVSCVPQELMQVFLNLLLNASQSFEGPGTIRLTARLEGDCALVEVTDDGAGIDPANVERIFEPFFTTKPVGEGTGLGLSMARQIVINHGGSIQVRPEPVRGTTFCIRLPLRAGAVSSDGAELV
ncbi:MAG: PAS domain-containing protein [Deltaproteobacteria bacterium]|nr:PAS domain-containing protein [Deltaproteobacteria bacterium]